MRYDLVKGSVPIGKEIDHQRFGLPDFFGFIADYSKERTPGAVMVAGDPTQYGHIWHCSLDSTTRRIEQAEKSSSCPCWRSRSIRKRIWMSCSSLQASPRVGNFKAKISEQRLLEARVGSNVAARQEAVRTLNELH